MAELQISVDEFSEFLKESARRFILIKAKCRETTPDKPEFTPEAMDELLFRDKNIPQVNGKISDFVYFITDGEYVKVGKGLPVSRMKSCQTGNPKKLRLLFTIPVGEEEKNGEYYWRKSAAMPAEDALHHLFRHYHVRGEWFDILDRLDWNRCREYFGTIYGTNCRDVQRYEHIMERRKKANGKDTLESGV